MIRSYLCADLRARVSGEGRASGPQQECECLGREERSVWVEHRAGGMAGSEMKSRQSQILQDLGGRARSLGFILKVSGSHWKL